MNFLKRWQTLLMCVCTIGMEKPLLGQEKETKKQLLREKNLLVLPVVFRYPETRIGGGIAGTASFIPARDSATAKPSQVSFGVTFTQNRQVLAFMPFALFLKNNAWYLNGDLGWYKYNYFYYGIGENRVPKENYGVRYPRVKLLAARRVSPTSYLGMRFLYENYNLTTLEPGGQLASGNIAGAPGSVTSGLGVSYLRDTRDAVFYPSRGVFAEAYFLPAGKALGGDRYFSRLYIDIAHYQHLTSRAILATNYVASYIHGREVPFSMLSMLGGSRKMRGLTEGFFRDKNNVLLQAELRVRLWKRLGGVSFASVGWLGDDARLIRWQQPKKAYGLGLRLATKNRLNLRLDYGFSSYDNPHFYATIGEAF